MSTFHQIYQEVFDKGIAPRVLNALSFMQDKLIEPVRAMLAAKEEVLKVIAKTVAVGALGVTGAAHAGGNINVQGMGTSLGVIASQVYGAVNGTPPNPNHMMLGQAVGNIGGQIAGDKNRFAAEAVGYAAVQALTPSNGQQQQQGGYYNNQQPTYQPAPQYQQGAVREQFPGQANLASNFRSRGMSDVQQIGYLRQNSQHQQADQMCANTARMVAENANLGIVDRGIEAGLRSVCPANIVQMMYQQQPQQQQYQPQPTGYNTYNR